MRNNKSFILFYFVFLIFDWMLIIQANEREIYIRLLNSVTNQFIDMVDNNADEAIDSRGIFFRIDAFLDEHHQQQQNIGKGKEQQQEEHLNNPLLGTGYSICNDNIARIKIRQPAEEKEHTRFTLCITAIGSKLNSEIVYLEEIGQPTMVTVDFAQHAQTFPGMLWVANIGLSGDETATAISYEGFLLTQFTQHCAEFHFLLSDAPITRKMIGEMQIHYKLDLLCEIDDGDTRIKLSNTTFDSDERISAMYNVQIKNCKLENKGLSFYLDMLFKTEKGQTTTRRDNLSNFACDRAPEYENSPNYYAIRMDWRTGHITCHFLPLFEYAEHSQGKKILQKRPSFQLFGATIEKPLVKSPVENLQSKKILEKKPSFQLFGSIIEKPLAKSPWSAAAEVVQPRDAIAGISLGEGSVPIDIENQNNKRPTAAEEKDGENQYKKARTLNLVASASGSKNQPHHNKQLSRYLQNTLNKNGQMMGSQLLSAHGTGGETSTNANTAGGSNSNMQTHENGQIRAAENYLLVNEERADDEQTIGEVGGSNQAKNMGKNRIPSEDVLATDDDSENETEEE